jgi:hypothetical protein
MLARAVRAILATRAALAAGASRGASAAPAEGAAPAGAASMYASLTPLMRALLEEKDMRLREKDTLFLKQEELLASVRAKAAVDFAHALLDADLARGVVDARTLLEAALHDAWTDSGLGRERGAPTSATERLKRLLSPAYPPLVDYLRAVARDNRVDDEKLILQARELYKVLCTRLHSEAASRDDSAALHTAFFGPTGYMTKLALASIVRFTRRSFRYYKRDAGGERFDDSDIILREPPPPIAAPRVEEGDRA